MSKFNIYKTEWLDLVFQDRNKSYGAYELRKNYSSTLLRSMAVAGIAFMAVFLVAWLTSSKPKLVATASAAETSVSVDMSKQLNLGQHPEARQATLVLPRGTVKPQQNEHTGGKHVYPYTSTIPLMQHPETTTPDVQTITPIEPAKPRELEPTEAPDEMPQPNGGKSAWADYLKQNLQYPDGAAKKGLSGRVRLTFIVEADGSLSDIKVAQPAGNGFDEEALRVVKASPAWKPGLQNGQPVRVRYSLPINFHIVK